MPAIHGRRLLLQMQGISIINGNSYLPLLSMDHTSAIILASFGKAYFQRNAKDGTRPHCDIRVMSGKAAIASLMTGGNEGSTDDLLEEER